MTWRGCAKSILLGKVEGLVLGSEKDENDTQKERERERDEKEREEREMRGWKGIWGRGRGAWSRITYYPCASSQANNERVISHFSSFPFQLIHIADKPI